MAAILDFVENDGLKVKRQLLHGERSRCLLGLREPKFPRNDLMFGCKEN
jgi:hypothetical protein